MCTLIVYKPIVWPVASFLDIQEVILLLGAWENTHCLYMQITATPLPGYAHIFQQYL